MGENRTREHNDQARRQQRKKKKVAAEKRYLISLCLASVHLGSYGVFEPLTPQERIQRDKLEKWQRKKKLKRKHM